MLSTSIVWYDTIHKSVQRGDVCALDAPKMADFFDSWNVVVIVQASYRHAFESFPKEMNEKFVVDNARLLGHSNERKGRPTGTNWNMFLRHSLLRIQSIWQRIGERIFCRRIGAFRVNYVFNWNANSETENSEAAIQGDPLAFPFCNQIIWKRMDIPFEEMCVRK